MKATSVVVVILTVVSQIIAAPGGPSLLGAWADAKGEYAYEFLKDHELALKGQETDYPCHAPCKSHDVETTGVWKSGPEVCVDKDGKPVGNLALHYDGVFCCMTAEIVGKKLVLFANGSVGYDRIGACRNRVLSRATVQQQQSPLR